MWSLVVDLCIQFPRNSERSGCLLGCVFALFMFTNVPCATNAASGLSQCIMLHLLPYKCDSSNQLSTRQCNDYHIINYHIDMHVCELHGFTVDLHIALCDPIGVRFLLTCNMISIGHLGRTPEFLHEFLGPTAGIVSLLVFISVISPIMYGHKSCLQIRSLGKVAFKVAT